VELTAAEIATATGGTIVAGSPDARATSFSIDSRLLEPGGCFVALIAARDGHDYLPAAWARGATVALVSRPVEPPPPDAAVVHVDDGLTALGALGAAARDRLHAARVVAITGSAGKTTTKDLTAAALASRRVHASPASFNNEAGVPLTLLGAPPDTEIIVTEMGARFAGNITALTAIAHPDIGIITHVGLAHAGHLGGADGVARVKGELVEALTTDGLAILNADCPYAATLGARTNARVVLVGTTPNADVRITELTLDPELRPHFALSTPWGSTHVHVGLHGEHHAMNAAMAATAAAELGVPLDVAAAGLADAVSAAARMELVHTRAGVTVINDAYNSSPTSAAAALHALGRIAVPGRRIAVLGEMLELGPYGPEAHAELGRLTGRVGIDLVVAVGSGAAPIADGARAVGVPVLDATDPCAAITVVTDTVRAGDAVLVKASRAVGLEHVAAALQPAEDERA
jgi:UDP-N-acetylmuramoyl-tripeptide--D-alanyl-D-alanine ligase